MESDSARTVEISPEDANRFMKKVDAGLKRLERLAHEAVKDRMAINGAQVDLETWRALVIAVTDELRAIDSDMVTATEELVKAGKPV